MSRKTVTNWGNYPVVEADVIESRSLDRICETIQSSEHLIARGNGRCYGDSSLSDNIFSALKLNRFLSFDEGNGMIECESGVLLSEVLDVIVPKGFFLPVTPGTKFITLAERSRDVHGKNHHGDGTFSTHVDTLTFLNRRKYCSMFTRRESRIVLATCGGMGLTGIILRAKFRLKFIATAFIQQYRTRPRY